MWSSRKAILPRRWFAFVKSQENSGFVAHIKKLNEKTIQNQFPLTDPAEIINNAAGKKYISKLDLKSGYYQFKMAKESQKYTAFRYGKSQLLEWTRMPFGISNSSRTCQRALVRLLNTAREYASNLLDDIIIYSEDWESHLKHVDDILSRLEQHGLTVNCAKCEFCLPKMEVLGYTLEGGKIKASDDKIKAITNLKPPTTKTQVRQILGLTGYYRKLIPAYGHKVHCLTELLKKSQPIKVKWEAHHQAALDSIKNWLTTEPVLVPADPNKDYILQTDCSSVSAGAILMQLDDDGNEHVIAYASRKLLPRERNYSTIERELLCIVWSLQHFEYYVYGKKVKVYSDHKGLQWLKTMATHNPRLQRWSLILERYDVTTTYKKAELIKNSDALSRLERSDE